MWQEIAEARKGVGRVEAAGVHTLRVTVASVAGRCPVYRKGDGFRVLDGYRLVAAGPVCLHALMSLAPYYVALSRGVAPDELGLAGPDGAA